MVEKKKPEKKSIKNKSAHDNEPASISLDGNSKKKVSKKGLESLNYSDYYKKYLESKKDDFELLAKKTSIDTIKDKEAIKDEIKAEAFYAESALDYTKEMKDESYSDHFKEMKDFDKKNVVISNEMKHDNKKEEEGEFVVRNQYHPSFNDVVEANHYDDLPDFDVDSSSLNFDLNKSNKVNKPSKQKLANPLNNNLDRFSNERFNQPIPSRMYIPKGYVRPMNPYGRPPFNPYFNPYFVPPYYYPPMHPGFARPNANPYQQPPYLNQQPPYFNQQQKELFPQQNSYTEQLLDFDPFANTTELVPVNNYNAITPNQNDLVVVNKKQSELSHIISSFNKRMKEQLRIVSKQNEMIERLQTKVIELTEEKTTALIGEARLSTEDFLPTTQHNFESVVADTSSQEAKPEVEVVAEVVQKPAEVEVITNIYDIESDDPVVDILSLEADDLINTENLDQELAAFEEFDATSLDDELDLSLLDDDITNTIQPQIKYELPVAPEDVKSEEPVAGKGAQFDLEIDLEVPGLEDSQEIYTPNQLLDLAKEKPEGIKNSIVPTKVMDEMFGDKQKSDPARRFWEAYVGNSEYGFYNNKTWNWKGKFSKLQKWIPFTSDEEVPFYGTKHVILSSIKASERKKLWKELIDDPVYGHFEGSSKVWIWHGVFDQELNWIPDPTHDFKTEEEVLVEKQKQSFPKKKEVSKKTNAPKVLKTNEITPDSDLHKMLLDDPRYKKHIGNVEYGYYDNDGVWIWTGTFDDNGEFKPDKVDLEVISDNLQSESNFSTLFDSWKKNNQNNLEYEIESKRFKTVKPKVVYVNEQEQPDDHNVEEEQLARSKATKNELIKKSKYEKPTDEDLGILTYDKSKIHDDQIVDASVLGGSSAQQAPFWLEFVGNEEYGHYNAKGNWIFDGYFDEQYEFVSTKVQEEVKQPTSGVSKTSILDDHANLDEYFKPASKEEILSYTPKAKKTEPVVEKVEEEFFTKFIGDKNYGYYNDKNVWVWSGYFNEYNQFVPDEAPKNNKLLDEIVSLAAEQQKEQDLLKAKVESELAAKQQAVQEQIQRELELRDQFLREQQAKEEALKLREQSLNEKAIRLKEEILKLKQQSLKNQEEAKKQALKEQELAEQFKQIKATKFIKPNKDNYKSIHQFVGGLSELSQTPTKPVEFAQPALKTAEFKFEPSVVEEKVEFVVKDKLIDSVDAIVVDTKEVELPAEQFSADQFSQQPQAKPQFDFKEELVLTEIIPAIVSEEISTPVVEISKPDLFTKQELDLSNVEVKLADQASDSEVVSVDLSSVELADSQFSLAQDQVEPVVIIEQPAHEEVVLSEPVVEFEQVQLEELDVVPLVEEQPEFVKVVEQPAPEVEVQAEEVVEKQPVKEVVELVEEPTHEETVEHPAPQVEEVVKVQAEEEPAHEEVVGEQPVQEQVHEVVDEPVHEEVVEEHPAPEVEAESVDEEVEFWEQYVGDEHYGHYDENEEWIWDGYFDEDNNFFRNEDGEQTDQLEEVEHVEEPVVAEEETLPTQAVEFDDQAELEEISEDDQPEPEIVDFSGSSESEQEVHQEPAVEEEVEPAHEEVVAEEEPVVEQESVAEEQPEVEPQPAVEEEVHEEQPAVEEPAEEAEFWEQYVGDEHYGHYDQDGEWVWAGYFDEDNNFIKNEDEAVADEEPVSEEAESTQEEAASEGIEEVEVEGEHYIYADENGEINFDDYIGNENFGYYLEDGEWEWYEGDFDEKGNWFVYVQGEPEEVNVEEDIPALKGVDTESVDADDWLSQFDEDAASAIFENEESDEDLDDDFGLLSGKKKNKKAKKAKK
ncbi:EAGR box-containing protein [Mycoplasmoides gallisepticum]|nr:EAGR box-containing protein [Mycoplasmoides gallisepticum]ULH62039.1 EAGR box-containing protein [Mycoplasmoides gallisepticum]ULH67381.1 EAGR box-containing protein [Mycoplasmoides gallisepticum]ULH68107.1 EAGR box-containing protein [Mycoplasmoides gallisepticum]WGG23705.1 EAGR box-containing protein [Mycoplasmoides gallisepticum]WGG24496.1 EAGR box-containing protein [Mycoplasmoides gallisepticum]